MQEGYKYENCDTDLKIREDRDAYKLLMFRNQTYEKK